MSLRKRVVILIALLCVVAQVGTSTNVFAQRKNKGNTADTAKPEKKGGKPRVIIGADASGNCSWTKELTESELENTLVQAGRFVVIAGSARDKLLNEQKFTQSDLVDPSKATEVGKLLSADYMVIGKCISCEEKNDSFSLGRFGSKSSKMKVSVQMQLYNMTTGQLTDSFQYDDKVEVGSTSVSGVGGNNAELPKNESYRKMMKDFAAKFVDRISLSIPISALVVVVKNGEVGIDAGAAQSVKPGMEFEVYTEGEPIRNSAGEILEYDITKHGKIRITRVNDKVSYGEVIQTFNNGQPDPSPNIDRIQRDYAVKQLNMSAPPSSGGDNTGKKKK